MRLLELGLVIFFYDRYRRIWVQYGKYSTIVTLFPLDVSDRYRIITAPRKIQDLKGLVDLITNKVG